MTPGFEHKDANALIALARSLRRDKKYGEAFAACEAALELCAGDNRVLSDIHNEKARLYLERKEYDLSIAESRKALGDNEKNGHAHISLAQAYKGKTLYVEALAEYEAALGFAGDDWETGCNICNEMAQLYLERNDLIPALALLNKARNTYRGNTRTLLLLGTVYGEQKRSDEALAALQAALKLCDNDEQVLSGIHNGIARAYLEQGKYDLAVAESKKAIELNGKSGAARLSLAIAYKENKQYEEALAAYDAAAALCENDKTTLTSIYNDRAQIYFVQKKYDLSITESGKALELDRENKAIRMFLAKVYREIKQYDKSLAVHKAALEYLKDDKAALSCVHDEIAEMYFEQGKLDLSLEEAKKAVEFDSENGHARLSLARVYKEQKLYKEALAEYEAALKLPGNGASGPDIHSEMARVYFELAQYERAVEEFKAALGVDKENARTRLSLAEAYKRNRQYEEALAEYNALAELRGNDRKFLSVLRGEIAGIYFEQGKLDLSLEEAKKAVEFDGENGPARLSLARAHRAKKEYVEAFAACDAALELSRDDNKEKLIVHNEKARIYFEIKEYAPAIAELKKAMEFGGEKENGRVLLGTAYKWNKQYSEALGEFNAALGACGDNAEILSNIHHEIARVYLDQKKYGPAITESSKALELDGRNGDAFISLALAYEHNKQYDEALSAYDAALELRGDNGRAEADIRVQKARVHIDRNDYEPALLELKKALGSDKDNAAIHLSLARVYREKNQYDDALAFCNAALKLRFDDQKELSNVHNEFARVYLAQQKYDFAVGEARKALELNREDEHSHLLLAEAYKGMKNYSEALAEYKAALEINGDNAGSGAKIHGEMARLLEQSDPELSIAEYKKAIELGDGAEETRRALGALYAAREEYEAAEKEFTEALKIRPSSGALRELVKIYKKQKRIDLCLETNAGYLKAQEDEDRRSNAELERKIKALGKDGEPGTFKVKIIRTPYFGPWKDGALNYSLLLPYGMGRIAGYLRSNGIPVDQDDLYIRLNHDNMFGKKEDGIDPDLFLDENRITAYSLGGEDAGLDFVMEKIEAKTGLSGYNVILLSVSGEIENQSGYLFVLAFTRYLKKKYNPFIIAGGTDREIDALLKRDTRDIDLVGRGKGEKLLFAALTALKYGSPLYGSPDLPLSIYGKVAKATENSPFGVSPDYGGLPRHLYGYRSSRALEGAGAELSEIVEGFNKSDISIAPYMLMEGCFYECIFCACSNTKEIFSLSPKQAVAQLRELNEKYGIRYFFFLNRLINVSKKFMNEFCDELIASKLDILWSDCARADNLDRELLLKMRKAGCVRLIYGLETASPRLLKFIDKRIKPERLEDIIRWTDEAGILSGLEIILGFPGETREDLQITVDFINRNKAYLNTVYCNILYVEKTSKLYSFPERYGIKNLSDVAYSDASLSNLKLGYDEINGLSWEERLKYMARAHDYVLAETGNEDFKPLYYEHEHLMFYLYSKFKDKKKIVDVFNAIGRAVS